MKYILLVALAATAASCTTGGCLDNGSALPLAGFYSAATGKEVSISQIQIRGIGAPADSVLLASTVQASKVYLPMRPDGGTTSWEVSYRQPGIDSPAYNDTIQFVSTAIPYFASNDCGAMYFYRIESVKYTRHLIDSIAVGDSLITNVERERIRIYFRTAQEGSDQ